MGLVVLRAWQLLSSSQYTLARAEQRSVAVALWCFVSMLTGERALERAGERALERAGDRAFGHTVSKRVLGSCEALYIRWKVVDISCLPSDPSVCVCAKEALSLPLRFTLHSAVLLHPHRRRACR